MKTRFLTFCCALLGFGAMAMADGVTFTYTSDGNDATITGVINAEETLTIPSTVGEGGSSYTVVAIGDAALHNGSYTSVTIPYTVTSIGDHAFANCTLLKTVTFGEDGTTEQTSLRLKAEETSTSQLLTIGVSAFNGDVALESITIPASVTTIANDAFAGCTSLESVTFEDDSACTSIGESAFNSCSSLKSFTFPEGVTVVANDILAGCTSLASVTFSEATTEIGGSAFASCESLTSVTLPETLETIGYYCFGESGLTSITIPASVTSIGDMAFAYLTFGENGVTNESEVVLTSNMFYKSNVETDYMEWDEITDITVGDSERTLITWEELEDYRYIKFEITYNEEDGGYNSYAPGAIYFTTGSEDWATDKLYDLPTSDQGYTASEVIYKISTLKADVEQAYTDATVETSLRTLDSAEEEGEGDLTVGFYVAAWSPATAVTLSAGPKIILPENKAYSFDDEVFASLQAVADYTFENSATFTTDEGLSIIVGDSESCKFQANGASVMVGTEEDDETPILYTPSYRLQMGSGAAGTKACIGVPVEGDCTLYVVAASSGSADRYVMVSDGSTVINAEGDNSTFAVASKDAAATTNCLFSCDYEGKATTLYLYSKSSSINFFYIYVSYDGSAPTFPVAPEDTDEGGITSDITIGDSFISRFANQTSIWGIEGKRHKRC